MPMRFANRTVIVTGAAGGIGFACVSLFLDEGANVILADIDEEALGEAVAALPAAFARRAVPVVCDVGNRRQVEALIAHAALTFGQLDALVCAAGIVQRGAFSDMADDALDRILRVNLKGAFLCVQAASKAMLEQRERGRDILGSIVTFSADEAFAAIPHIVPHVVAAAGVERMTQSLARGFAQAGLRINTVAVGLTDTAMLRAAVGTGKTALNAGLARTAQGRVQPPEAIARIAAFLSSAEAGAVTGQVMGTCGSSY